MPRLLHVSTVARTLSAFLLPFARHFRSLGWQVDGAASGICRNSACTTAFERTWDMEWSRNPLAVRNMTSAATQIRQIVLKSRYDIVHVHTPVAAFVTRLALRNVESSIRPIVIYTAHGFHFYEGGQPLRNAFFLGLERLAAKWTDYLVVINKEDADAALRNRFLPPNRICYMPGIGIDVTMYSRPVEEATLRDHMYEELAIPEGSKLILTVAELIPRKRVDDAICALARLRRRDVHLAVAGEGRLLKQMKQLTLRLGLCDRVHFLGFRHDIPRLMKISCAVLLTSQQEGLPRSVMEAMAVGTPVIGSDIRGVKDLLSDGAGLLVPVGDIQGWTRAVEWVLDHPNEANAMVKAAKERVEQCDIRTILQMHEQLYERALASKAHTFCRANVLL